MKKLLLFLVGVVVFLVPAVGLTKTAHFIQAGYVDLETIVRSYTPKYLDKEIALMQEAIGRSTTASYNSGFYTISDGELCEARALLQERRSGLDRLRNNKRSWNSCGELGDAKIAERIQKDIMDAIRKTGIIEGYSLIFDSTDNLLYGSDEVDLTKKVLFKLDERLLDYAKSDFDELGLY
ncbi:MAG TPA: OmpH family outer membrane protein [Spirochaetota bacterium]|nr:OmpH family outer membrane protein [Spirochaetota bacterium]